MLSAAAAALLAAVWNVSSARGDTEISVSQSTPVTTANTGNLTIDTGAAISISTAAVAAVTINSSNSVINNGNIANNNVANGIGILIDTSSGNLVSTGGLASTGTIDVSGSGTGKDGILITGGHTLYGPITLTSLTAITTTGTAGVAQQSGMVVKGDSSFGLLLVQGTSVTSNIFTGGGGIIYNASDNSTQSNSIVVDLDGKLNGNFINGGAINAVGPGVVGIYELGGIASCASDTSAPSGFTCPTSSGGSFVNQGNISVQGTAIFNPRGGNAESGSAIVVANSIAGGFLNMGPATASNITAAQVASAGLVGSGIVNPTMLIDPSRSITGLLTAPRSPIILGPLTADVDPVDPGYAFANRGTLSSQPIDPQLSTGALVIQGLSSTYTTCLSAAVNACSGLNATNPTLNTGGLLNTGTISAIAQTNQQIRGAGVVSASAVYLGGFAIIPRFDVKAEVISGNSTTPGTVSATVSGNGQGNAFAITIAPSANVPVINIGKGAQVTANVLTSTTSPTKDIAPASAPFSLVSEAIVDQSNSLVMINNAGLIQALNTTLTPAVGASTINIQRAIDLQASTTAGITINNSGRILGDVYFGSAGNGDTLNVGNVGGTASAPTANPATGLVNSPTTFAIVAESILSQNSGSAPTTQAALLDFGSGTGQTLHVGGYGYVNAVINAGVGALNVQVDSNGQLFVANTTQSLQANNFTIGTNGLLGLSISQANVNNGLTPVVQAVNANLTGASLGLQFGTYVSAGTNAAAVAAPSEQTITLVRATTLTDTTLADQNALLGQNTPFLFESPTGSNAIPASSGFAPDKGPTPLSITSSGAQQTLLLHLLPRSVNATNADGSPGLNLSGDAKYQFPFVSQALSTDDQLGAAVATSMTIYNTPGLAGSGINVVASQQQAQKVFSQFSPDVSGGTREIAIMLTDQATGPVAARQRLLRSYGTVAGDMTLWGEEFAGHINNKGRPNGANELTSFKDHGFGFAIGVDGGSPRNGWYGGAFTFYSGDVSQIAPRATKTQTEWYMVTGYTDWRGKHVFLDTQISAAYGNFAETRQLDAGSLTRVASSKRPGAMLALGANTGVILHALGMEVTPHISLDGLTLREEGYGEKGGGSGFNLDVAPYFANSLRTAIGTDFKGNIRVFGFDLTPEARLGYRYDLLHQAVKIRAAFDSTGGLGTTGNTMTFIGPDPDTGNVFGGLSLGAGTDSWKLGVNYDWVRGNNGSTTQVGTLTVLGRI